MKKTLLVGVLFGMPLLANAHAPAREPIAHHAKTQFGDKDHRGYYWDGHGWQTPGWWQKHRNRHVGLKGPHGYWNGHGWQRHAPQRSDAGNPHANRRDHHAPRHG